MCKRNIDRKFSIKFGWKILTYKVVWTLENHLTFLGVCAFICNMRGIAQNYSSGPFLLLKLFDSKASFCLLFRNISGYVSVNHIELERTSKQLKLSIIHHFIADIILKEYILKTERHWFMGRGQNINIESVKEVDSNLHRWLWEV